jgi:hypothetical protein
MISPTDTAYRLLPTSPSARELMDAYTPGLFELKFAEERTRQAAPRVGLLFFTFGVVTPSNARCGVSKGFECMLGI